MPRADHALFANHRRFLEAQRGPLTRHTGYDVIHGDVPAFRVSLLYDAGAAAEAATKASFVFAPPWADPGPAGFSGLAYQLTHMSLPRESAQAPAPRPEFAVETAHDEASVRTFTEVQAAGFAPAPSAYDDLFAWMWDKNQRAWRCSDQHFYCLCESGRTVSVLLTVESDGALGIYAVATPPALRRRGLSSFLLQHVCANAPSDRQICLQVVRSSDAERLYAKLGFVERFVVNVYATGH